MPTFQITGPDGKKYRVTGDNPAGAMAALKRSIGDNTGVSVGASSRVPVDQPWYVDAAQAADDIARLAASGLTFGYADKIAGALGGEGTEVERARTREARERAGSAGLAAEIGGAIATPVGLAGRGLSLAGRVGTDALTGVGGLAARSALMGAEGAGYGALTSSGNDQDISQGLLIGALGGLGGNIAGEGISALGQKLGRGLQIARSDPQTRAAGEIFRAAQGVGPDDALRSLTELGPEAMAVDVLGKRGTAMARAASNLSPESREIMETSLLGRKAGQNERIVSALEDVAGLPRGNRMGVKELQRENYEAAAPQINEAYEAARAAGFDLPRTPFKEILESPMGRQAYDQAAESLKNRKAVSGMDANSELARLDQTKRILDSKASIAYRQGDNDTGEQAASLSRKLREIMDETIAGPEYSTARSLRKQEFDQSRAIEMGGELAGGRIPLGLPGQVAQVGPENAERLAQGYAARQAENLLNRGATEGALSKLSTPMGREAYEAALGDRAPAMAQALARERAFNATARDITGNSTTARQLAEMAGTGMGVGGAAMMMGADATTGGAAGIISALLRRGGPALARKISTDAQRSAAPHIAELLTRRALPASRPIPENFLERLSKEKRDAIVRALMGGGVNIAVSP